MSELRQSLKELTAPFHARIEQNRFAKALMEGRMDRGMYAEWLRVYGGFHQAIEGRLLAFEEPFAELGIAIGERLRAELIAQDLRDLGVHEPVTPASLPSYLGVSTFAEAMGVVYVLEGSTMGGQRLAGMLQKSLGETLPVRYLYPYGGMTMAMWQGVVHALERFGRERVSDESVIMAACGTFLALGAQME